MVAIGDVELRAFLEEFSEEFGIANMPERVCDPVGDEMHNRSLAHLGIESIDNGGSLLAVTP